MEARAKKIFDTATSYAITGACTSATLCHVEPSHVQGARDPRNTTIIGLYRNGLCSAKVAVAHGAKPKDHLEAIRHGVSVDSVMSAGVELQQIQRAESRMNGKAVAQIKRQAAAVEASKPRQMMVVRKANGPATVVMSGIVPIATPAITPHQVQVAMALVRVKHAETAKRDAERNRKHGISVTLSADEQKAIVARNLGKEYRSDK